MKTSVKMKSKEPTGKVKRIVIEPAQGGYSVSTHREPASDNEMPYHDPKPHVFTHHAPMLKHVKMALGCSDKAAE